LFLCVGEERERAFGGQGIDMSVNFLGVEEDSRKRG